MTAAGGSVDRPSILRGSSVLLRPLRPEDVERVAVIQAQPGVARWWGPPDQADIRAKADGSSEEKSLAIEPTASSWA